LKHKEIVVADAMKRIGKVQIGEILPIVPAIETEYYRNKLEFTFSNKKWLTKDEISKGTSNYKNVLGFHRPRAFDKIVEIEHCYLQKDPSNEMRNTIRDIGVELDLDFLDLNAKQGFLRHLLFRTTSLNEIMVIVSFYKEDKKKRIVFLDAILKRFPQIDSLHYCINPKENDFILDLEIHTYHGKGYVEENLGEVKFRIGPKSFFHCTQVLEV
jgi:23S rRNA (uracil1939-C5)-methyltransferase